MKNDYKLFLKIGLIAYIVVEIISILNVFEISEIESFTKLSAISIPISTLILIIYASNKGDNNLCKIGFILLAISVVLRILLIYDIVEYSYTSDDNTLYKIVMTIRSIAASGLSFCGVLALFSIIPSTSGDALKGVTLIGFLLYYAINCSSNLIDYSEMDWINKAESIIYIIANTAEWSFIAQYLLGKQDNSVDSNYSSQQVIPQQYYQPMPQQMPPQYMPPAQQGPMFPPTNQPGINPGQYNNRF